MIEVLKENCYIFVCFLIEIQAEPLWSKPNGSSQLDFLERLTLIPLKNLFVLTEYW